MGSNSQSSKTSFIALEYICKNNVIIRIYYYVLIILHNLKIVFCGS